MANQIAIASTMLGVMEALRYAVEAGLDPDTVLESIGAGAAGSWSMSNMVPRVVKEDYAPGFAVRHFVKDLNIAEAEAAAMDLQLAGLGLAARLYRGLEEEGRGGEGTQAIYRAVGRGEADG